MAGPENHAIEQEVHSAGRLVKVHVTASAMVGGQVEDHAHALDGALCDILLTQVPLHKLHSSFPNVGPDILELASAEIIDDPYPSSSVDKGVDKTGADERRASGDQNIAMVPVHASLLERVS